MKRKLVKNHASLMSMIPKEIVDDLGLKVGDKLDFSVQKGKIIAKPVHANRQVENVQAAAHEPFKVGGCNE